MTRSLAICSKTFIGKHFLFILVIAAAVNGNGQTIEYSKQNFKAPIADAMQLVANIGGYHHLLCFSRNEKVALYVYNNQLQLDRKTELEIKLHEDDDVNIIPFSSFYFLYLHQPGSISHQLWKIDAKGNSASVSGVFMALIDTVFKKNTATLQLVNKNNHLCIIGNRYYDEAEKIGSTVVQADDNLNFLFSRQIFYDYKKYEENLKQVMLAGDDLLILKTSRDSAGHLLQVIKANLNTGKLVMNAFNSGSHLFANPGFRYNNEDSTILLYSMIDRTVFITRLDSLLNENVPVTLLKRLFRNGAPFNFLLPGQKQSWLSIHSPGRVLRTRSASYVTNVGRLVSTFDYTNGFDMYGNLIVSDPRYAGRTMSPSRLYDPYQPSNYNRFVEGSGVRFSLLNSSFKVAKDSVVANDKNSYSILPTQSATAVLQNRSYLFLRQQFGSSRRGLLSVYVDGKGELVSDDIRVYDKYEYLLPQLQAVNEKYVIMPYTYKRELGLVKITWNE